MMERKKVSKQRKFFALTASVLLIMSVLIIGISFNIPNVTAAAVNHNVGHVKLNMLNDMGRILIPIDWFGTQTVKDLSLGFIGLVIDHDKYDHTPGNEVIADSFLDPASQYAFQDDFQPVRSISMLVDNGTIQKSFASYQNIGASTLFPNDLLINQTAFTVVNKDWAIIQWTLTNIKPADDLNNVRIGLEVPISKAGGRFGLGGNLDDSMDDIDGYNSTYGVYWAKDLSDNTTIGISSAIVSDPITHYYAEDYFAEYQNSSNPGDKDLKYWKNKFSSDAWLYSRISAPSATATDGITPQNITATVGWDGFDILVGESRTVSMVIAFNDSFPKMLSVIQDAQAYYQATFTKFQLSEIKDSGSGSAQIEVYNHGQEPTDPVGLLSFEADGVPLTVSGWSNPQIPTYGYSTATINGPVNPEGATIVLLENGIPIDSVSYGQKGIAPDPLDSESVSREFSTPNVNYTNNWVRDPSPTWDKENDVGTIVPTPEVVLNRVLFNSFGGDEVEEYVEIMYTGIGSVDVSGYKIVCDDEFTIPPIPVLDTSNRYYVFRQADFAGFFTNMNASADNVYLYDSNDNLLDMVGWNSAHNQGEYMTRTPDGNGTQDGFDDATSSAAGWVFNNLPNLIISEISVDDATTASVELFNPRGGDKVLTTRWTLDVETAPNTMTGTWTTDDIIPAGGYRTFDRTGGAQLNPEGDTISLYHRTSELNGDVAFGTSGIAPDPLVGESTARFWDTNIPGYTNDWNRDPTATFGSQNDVPGINTTKVAVMNEVMFDPSLNPDGKFVVIVNTFPFPVNISNFALVADDAYQLPSYPTTPGGFDGILQFGWSFIIRYGDDPNANNFFQGIDAAEDNVYFYDSNGRLIDMVGWDSAHTTGMSVKREPYGNGTQDGYHDTSSVAAGWVFDSPLAVTVTEISDSQSSPGRIEVFNNWYPTIDFNVGFTFDSTAGITGSWEAPGTADAGGYAVFDVTSGLDFEGDTISFLQNSALIDELSYGLNGVIPDPLMGESVQRLFDANAYSTPWGRNISTGPNFGFQNDIPAPASSSQLRLNEILFNPSSPSDAFVELFLRFGVLNISGYRIVCDTEFIVPDGTVLTPDDPFFYLLQPMDSTFFLGLTSTGDNVYLYNATGAFIDMAGWSSLHTQGMSMARIPHGNGTRDGYDDISSVAAGWVFETSPSIQMIKVSSNEPEEEIKGFGGLGDILTFNLTVTNKQNVDDTILFFNSTLNGYSVLILDETGTFIITEMFVPALTTLNFTVKIFFPTSIPFAVRDNITISIQSQNESLFMDNLLIQAIVVPFIQPEKYADPLTIYTKGTGHDEITTITLNLTGMGSVMELKKNQDVVFCVDTSGSMDPASIPLIIDGLKGYVDEMEDPDQGALIQFGVNYVELLQPLTNNYTQLKTAIDGIPNPPTGPSTPMGDAIAMAIAELQANGNSSHIQVIILLTDGVSNAGSSPLVQADVAAANNITIYTIGLGPGVDENTLKDIANRTGGQYFYVDNPNDLPGIYMIIAAYIGDLAGRDGNPNDALRMVVDVIPPWIEVFPGSFSIPPDSDTTNGSGYRTLEWNVNSIKINESWEVTFQIRALNPGFQPSNFFIDSRVYYLDYFDNVNVMPFPESWINVLPGLPSPPILEIEMSSIDDVLLRWDQRVSPGTDHYLIYRSSDPRQFDFSSPWVDTSDLITGVDPGDGMVIPKRTTWNDTGAAYSSEQWYYCLRAVNNQSEVSHTSRTVGKWTKTFEAGSSSFSLPLQPLDPLASTADNLLSDMGANYIKWMDPSTNEWLQHGGGPINDGPIEVGKGYEVSFGGLTKYTFLGMPAAQIRYHTRSTIGFDPTTEADSLYATVNPANDEISLFWQQPSSMWDPVNHFYNIYRSTTRDGFDDGSAQLVTSFSVGPLTWKDTDLANASTQYYYMLVPMNGTGVEGASSYSVGVVTLGISDKYDTIGIPLKLHSGDETADFYCDAIGNSVGINYYEQGGQRWSWHSTIMPSGAFDPTLVMAEGYQISTSGTTKYSFIGY